MISDCGGNERLLLVDDEMPVLSFLSKLLLANGYHVTIKTNGFEALEWLQERPEACDLVITDLAMPEMNGIELARKMKEINPDLPVILCTGYAKNGVISEWKAMGFKHVLRKPISKEDLMQTIRVACNKLK